MSSIKRFGKTLAAAAIALTAATQVSAGGVVTAVTNNDNYTWNVPGLIALPSMATPFFAHPGGRLVAIYSAECAVNAPAGNTTAWVDVDIVVRNAAGAIVATMSPTAGSLDAFCSSNGTAGFDGWAMNSIAAVVTQLAAGNYRVQVMARLNNGATGGFMGQRSLVVLN